MRICFIDFAPWDYDVATPTARPLGGSQSAMCYLAVELAKAGHDVTVVTKTTKPDREVMGVTCSGSIPSRYSVHIDVMVALNAPGHGVDLRSILPSSAKLLLWTQHAANQPVMRRRLASPADRDVWDSIVCVSDWQRSAVIESFDINPERVCVIRNAIAPAFESLFASHADLVAAKSGDVLRLAYTSTPYRGLKLLPDIFRAYHAANPDGVLEVFSSMAVYMEDAETDRDKFGCIYDAVSATDGAELVGSLPQPELAKRLRGAHILAYPNAFPETSCIAVMEALACGMRVVTSDLGALPETCEGFARLVPIDIEIDDEATLIDVKNGAQYASDFQRALMQSTYTTAGLYDQVQHMNTHHTWSVRAREWEKLHAA
jgi:glycosyltransferase involved in cell wall biosynthesis